MSKVIPVVQGADGNFRVKSDGDTIDIGIDLDTKVDKGTSDNGGEAIGLEANAKHPKSLSVGSGAYSEGQKAIAIGSGTAVGSSAIAVGADAIAKGAGSVVIGAGAESQAYHNVVIGTTAKAADVSSVAIGQEAVAGGKGSIAIGQYAATTEQGTATFGSTSNRRRIVNVGDGINDFDAVNMKQLRESSGSDANPYIKTEKSTENPAPAVGGGDGTIVIGSGAGNGVMDIANKATVVGALSKSLGDGGSVYGYNCSASGTQALAVGFESSAQGDNTVSLGSQSAAANRGGVAIGWNAQSLADDAIVVGKNAKGSGNGSIVVGGGANTGAQQTIVLGTNASAAGNNGVAVGQSAKSVFNSIAIGSLSEATGGNATLLGYGAKAGQGSTAVGQSAAATKSNALALGVSAEASEESTVAVGASAKATHSNSVALGSGSTTSEENTIAVGSQTQMRKISWVARGTNPNDVVTVAQLNELTTGMIRKVVSGNITWNTTDNKSAASAAGKLGSGCYLKFTVTLDAVKAGVVNLDPTVTLTKLPCDEHGNVIPHQVNCSHVSANGGRTPKITVVIFINAVPTHTIDRGTFKITPVGRNDNGLSVGIPEIPIRDGLLDTGAELQYSVTFMANAGDLV